MRFNGKEECTMTVKELINELQGMPQDAEVWQRYPIDDHGLYGADRVNNIEVDNDGDVVLC
jgi:hypothetical protein